MGEASLMEKDPGNAAMKFQQALDIDADSARAKAGKVVATAVAEVAPEVHSDESVVDHFSSYLNVVGISLSRSKQIEKALTYYKSALFFVRERKNRGKVWFNVGMCHLRDADKKNARSAFKQALQLTDGKLIKAIKYLQLEGVSVQESDLTDLSMPAGPTEMSATDTLDDDDLFESIDTSKSQKAK